MKKILSLITISALLITSVSPMKPGIFENNTTVTAMAATYAQWDSTKIYNTGDIVSYGGKLWESQWWNQNQIPGTTGQWGCWREYSGGTSTSTDTQAPTAPGNLNSTAKTNNSISIQWSASTDNVGVTQYEIYLNSKLSGTSTTTGHTLTGLSAGTSYTITVKAKDAAGNASSSSKSISVTTNSSGTTIPYASNIPLISISTENGQEITSKEVYVNATAQIQDSQANTSVYNGSIQIRGRGNSTWMVAKKPYRIKLDTKTDLFGMGKSKDWVLLANYYDQTVMRNILAYDLARKMGFNAPRCKSVDLIMNGSYAGNYLLCENVKIAKDRVNIFDWEEAAEEIAKAAATKSNSALSGQQDALEEALKTNLTWTTTGTFTFKQTTLTIADYYDVPAITGGYLLELDDTYDEISKFKTASQQPIMFKSPEYANTNEKMMSYIKNYIQAFESAIKSNDYHTTYEGKRVHYSDLVDMDSLVDFWVLTEVFSNLDCMFKSTYMYKDIDGKLVMGPLWDWDLCAGGSMVIEYQDYTQTWQTVYRKLSTAQGDQWYRYLIKDPVFLQKAYDRYHSIRKTLIEDMIKSGGTIDQLQKDLAKSGQENLKVWPSNGIGFGFWPGTGNPNGQGTTTVPVYGDKVNELKSWLNKHLTWLDTQFGSVQSLRSSLGVK